MAYATSSTSPGRRIGMTRMRSARASGPPTADHDPTPPPASGAPEIQRLAGHAQFTAGAGGEPTMIGGLSIPYATIPMNKRTGITIGGTKYFMVFPLLADERAFFLPTGYRPGLGFDLDR
jgi:hypothetical protein